MIILPAIDLRNGRVVRLRQGRAEAETVYGDDPAQIAVRWEQEGAEWLHVVNLDAALGENSSTNERGLAQIISAVKIPVQVGGGLRDRASINNVFALGAARVVIGTAAIENHSLVSEALERFGAERVAIGIDARGGLVSTRGWCQQSSVSSLDVAREMRDLGVTRIIVTDIARDGMLRGVDAAAAAEIGRGTGLRVIASGGVAGVGDVEALRAYREIEGVIIGQALYSGRVSLKQVLGVQNSVFRKEDQ